MENFSKTICFFDIESTGLEITKDRIIQLSLIKTNLSFEILDKKKLLLSNCEVPIHKKAFEAHGINELDLIKCYPFSSYAQKVFNYINECDYIGGHNIKKFDILILSEEFSRCGISWEPKKDSIIDTYVIMSNRIPRTLEFAYQYYVSLEGFSGSHDAENDVLATIEVLKGQIKAYKFDELYTQTESGTNKYPLEKTLAERSKYKDEDKRLSFDGKIVLDDENIPIFTFGKFKDQPIKNADLGYINWILTGDFPSQTKNVLRTYLNK